MSRSNIFDVILTRKQIIVIHDIHNTSHHPTLHNLTWHNMTINRETWPC